MNTQPAEIPAEPDQPINEADLMHLARRIIHWRRKRDAMLAPVVFADPEWDILLDLFAEGGFGRKISMSSLCIAAAVPNTTAVRCIHGMIDQGILTKSRDASDARRVLIELTDETRERMRRWLTGAARAQMA